MSKLDLPNFEWDKHIIVLGYTGSGKSVLGYELFKRCPHAAIFFNSQENKYKDNIVTVHTAQEALTYI